MSLIVQKYGGSSLRSPAHIQKVAKKISDKKKEGHQLVIVVSAMGHTTDYLLKLAHEITPHPCSRELDMLLSAGERISMSLLAMALNQLGLSSISFTGSQSGIVTDTRHTDARILEVKADRIKAELALGKTVIVAGFQGVSTTKEVTTLGRGGSDVTAVALAVKLNAARCEFFKDVDGVYTKDPKTHHDAQKLSCCDYVDVLKLVNEGATVFHPEALHLDKRYALPLYLSSTFGSNEGTVIQERAHV